MAHDRAVLAVFSAAVVSALLGSSCGGGGGGGGGGATGPAVTQAAFIDQYCGVYRPCCAAAGRPADGASCRDALNLFPGLFLATTYNQADGEACLAALRAAAMQPGFCDATAEKPAACDPALGRTGSLVPGATCNFDDDCAPSADGHVVCFEANVARACQIQIRGQAGDGPCVWTVEDDGTYGYSGPLLQDGLPRGYVCHLSDGVFCDAGTACAARKAPGESCATSGSESCVETATCDSTQASGTCVARKAPGDPCAASSDQCAKGYFCKTSTLTCAPQLPFGAACASSFDCLSGNCPNGACGDNAGSELSFLCGGP